VNNNVNYVYTDVTSVVEEAFQLIREIAEPSHLDVMVLDDAADLAARIFMRAL